MQAEDRSLSPWRRALRESRWLLALDLVMLAAVFVADDFHLILFSKTPYLLALGWVSLALRGVRWRDLGLRLDARWPRLLLMGLTAGVAMEALELFVTQPLLVHFTGKYSDLSDFDKLVGNVKLLLIFIGLSWVVAAFGEELVWRGYVMNRLTDLFGRNRMGWAAALLVANLSFGLAHSYQDITGIVENSLDGLLLGLLYLAAGRNLLVPIIAHGITDSIDFLIIFSGHYPGMH